MNTLSWMIYAADVAGGIDGTAQFVAGVSILAATACVAGSGLLRISAMGDDIAKSNALLSAALWRFFPAGFGLALLASVIPSQSTIYAIAASEMGEDVLNSAAGSKAMQALDAWLDRQIEGGIDQ